MPLSMEGLSAIIASANFNSSRSMVSFICEVPTLSTLPSGLFEFGVEEANCASTSRPIIHNITYLYTAYNKVMPPIAKIM